MAIKFFKTHEKAFKKNWEVLECIPKHLKTYEMCLEAVKQNGGGT